MASQAMEENEFKQRIYEKYKAHFDHAHALHRFAEEALSGYRGIRVDAYHEALQYIFPRAFKAFDSVRRLCEIASCEDAAVVLRSLLNLMAVTRWLSADPSKRAARYLHWYHVEMYRQAEKFRDRIPPVKLAVVEKRYQRVKHQFEYKDANGRVRLVKQWYQPDAKTVRDLFEQTDLLRQYEEAYAPLSGIEHSDITAFFAMVATVDKSGDEMRLEVQSDLFVPHYLRNAFQYFADIFRTCNKTIAFADGAQLERTVSEGMKFHEADMRARGISPI